LAIFSEKELADLTVAVGVMGAYDRLAISFHVETPLDLAANIAEPAATAFVALLIVLLLVRTIG
jgi:hypothetical protein